MMRGDEYLAPVVAELGAHQGLNANWSSMAWLLGGNMAEGTWLLDDEGEESVSLVTRRDDGSGDPCIVTICSGTVEQILPIAMSIAVQVQFG